MIPFFLSISPFLLIRFMLNYLRLTLSINFRHLNLGYFYVDLYSLFVCLFVCLHKGVIHKPEYLINTRGLI